MTDQCGICTFRDNKKDCMETECSFHGSWHAKELRAELAQAEAENERLRKFIEEISKGKGAYSQDRLKHAANTIENMKRLAADALEGKEFDE